LMDGLAVEYVWMLCRMSSEFLISISPGCITTTWGTNLQPCWSMTAFALLAPLAPGAEATALARPLLPPTTTFSMLASVPHFSVSLLTLSFSTCGAPLYFTSTSTVPPPCAPARRGPAASITALPTSAMPVRVPHPLRMRQTPASPTLLFEASTHPPPHSTTQLA